MKHIIGIDAGTNSTGWTLTKEFDNGKIELIDIGSYIFPIGTNVDDKSHAETTKNEQRREYRGAKRNLFRYKLRRIKLKKVLNDLGMLPDFKKLDKEKGIYKSCELYKLRAEAIKQQIPLKEIGRIYLLLNKHRGFKSNSKKLGKEKDDGVVVTDIKDLKEHVSNAEAKTLGEYFYKMHLKAKDLYDKNKWHNPNELIDERAINEDGELVLYNSRGIRRQYGRYTAREMYQEEFDLIWKTQKNYYDNKNPNIFTGDASEYEEIKKLSYDDKKTELKKFKKTNYWLIRNYCIYYQRPLRSQKKYLSKCQFEKNKKVIPASHPHFQEFRVWKNLSDLRYYSDEEDIINQPLPLEWKKRIAENLKTSEKIFIAKPKNTKSKIDKTYLIDILTDANPNIKFKTEDDENEKEIKGNLTYFAFHQALGEFKFNELMKQNKLDSLWHHIYMAKDDEWLKDILLFKWKFDKNYEKNLEIVNKLIDFGLEEDYGSYSSKVIKKILPFMKDGNDEYSSLVLAGFFNSNDEVHEVKPLKDKITQLKYQELRNPVVEKAVSKSIKIVNAILEKYKNEIVKEKFEIRIESTREFKKPRQERENMLRGIRQKDKERQEYADFLNKQREEGKLNFSRKIQKYDSIISKFELWLEMKMDKNDPKFKEFEKITKKGDREKHLLWLECNRVCPYTGKTIGLAKLFSSDIEIEHIIPLSRSLDDSFNNKTITFSEVNKEKGNRTAYEFMNWKNDLDTFKRRIEDDTNRFSDSKRDLFLTHDIPSQFTNNQISNTSYIAKYVKTKLMEVCRSVQFTTGSATSQLRRHDWKLADLLDKIRFEEETGIDVDPYLQQLNLIRKDFYGWYKEQKKYNNSEIYLKTASQEIILEFDRVKNTKLSECLEVIKKFDEFRNKSGKKDRSDHRHHAIDAFITSCCSRSITQYLSTYHRIREEHGIPVYDEYGNITRELIERPFDYDQLKQKIKEILVCHDINQKLITSRKNKHRTSNRIKEQRTYAPQGSLHKDGIYGKLKEAYKQGIDKTDAFVKRIPLLYENEVAFITIDDLEKVYDKNVREILTKRIEKYGDGKKAFSKDALEKDPLFLYSLKKNPKGFNKSNKGKPLPVIKNVRVLNKNSRNLIQLPAKDEDGNIINKNRYAESSGNYIIVYYELRQTDKKGSPKKPIRDYKILSFFEAVKSKSGDNSKKLFLDEIEKNDNILGLKQECRWLKQGDMVIMYENEQDKKMINWSDRKDLCQRLFVIKQISESVTVNKKYGEYYYGNVALLKANCSSSGIKYSSDKYFKGIKAFSCSHVDLNAIKVRLNLLGIPEKIGEECFKIL